MPLFLILIFEYFKIGLFSVGGGLATLPFLYDLAGKKNWFESANIPDMLAVAQLLPGAIGVNLAAFTGSHLGVLYAYLAVIAMITPQIIVIIFIARSYESFNQNKIVKNIFSFLTPAAAALLCFAALSIWKPALFTTEYNLKIIPLCIFAAMFALIKLTKLPVVFFLAVSGAAGVLLEL